jgi:uncharacterized protein (TIGR02117 family)
VLLLLPLAACAGRMPAVRARDTAPSTAVHVVSNGWHSGLVLQPAQLSASAWPEAVDFTAFRYVELGWGDAAAYTADHLTTGLGLGAAFHSTASALYLVAFTAPLGERFEGLDVVMVPLEPPALDTLARFIRQSFARDRWGHLIWIGPGPAEESAFYLATDRYHLFNTCNTWVARALRSAGRPITPAVTLTAAQLMQQVASFGIVLQSRVR